MLWTLHKPELIIDLETTSIAYRPIEIVEFGAIKVTEDWEIEDRCSWLFTIENIEHFDSLCRALTGLRVCDVQNGAYFIECWKGIMEWCEWRKRPVLGWNVHYDYSVLLQNFFDMGIDFPFSSLWLDVRAWVYAYCRYQGLIKYDWSLQAICEKFEIPIDGKHRALSDAMSVFKLVKHIIGDLECSNVLE